MKTDVIENFISKLDEGYTYIVRILLKYKHEKYFRDIKVILSNENGVWTWFYDWYEGEEEIYVVGYVKVDDVIIGKKEIV